jgi:hypothetical protein
MDGLEFITATAPLASDPARADIACFIGFVARRPVAARRPGETDEEFLERLPSWLREWFRERGWEAGRDGRTAENLVGLEDIPVPIDSWDVFDSLFAWDMRPLDPSGRRCDTTLGAAVRSFFVQGGRKCHVIRLGDPWPVLTPSDSRGADSSSFLPVLPPLSPVDRSSWRGIGHLFGLPDVSFLCLPDLPELFAVTPLTQPVPDLAMVPEVFVECVTRVDFAADRGVRGIPAPRDDENGFRQWSALVRGVGEFLRRGAREVQFIATIPLPVDDASLVGQPAMASKIREAHEAQWTESATIQTAFVQLVYPWVQTRESSALPGNLEAPDGLLAGLLANHALTRSSWRSAIRQPVSRVQIVEPVLSRAMLERNLPLGGDPRIRRVPLKVRDRVTLIGPTPAGFRLLSDVTTDDDEAYRPANVNRLVTAIVRAARVTGESAVFQNNGPALWNRLCDSIVSLLMGVWADGALAGASADEAFEVRCDRSTMTQTDIDAGRVIVRISFTAAAPIVQVTVVLAMDEGGNVSIASRQSGSGTQSQAA